MVTALSHFDRDGRRTSGHLGHGHGIAGHRSRCNTRRTGRHGDRAIADLSHREGRGRGIVVNGRSRLANAQRSRSLTNGPGHVLSGGSTVRPLIVGLRCKGRRIASRIRAGLRAANSQGRGAVVVPGRRLSTAGIRQCPLLRRNGQAADTRYGSGLISRRLVVCTFSHLNGDRRRTRRLLGHRHGIAGHGHLSHTRRTGRRGDCAVAGLSHREGRGRGIVVNSRSRLVNVQRPSRLFNLPGYAQRICGTVDPAIAIFRRERRGIGLCVRTSRLAAHD